MIVWDTTSLKRKNFDQPKVLFCVNRPLVLLKQKDVLLILNSRIEKISWEEAFSNISQQLKKTQKKNPDSIGLYVDDQTFRRGFDSLQSLFFSLQLGSTSFYTDQCRYDSPRLLVTEWMIGHATPLLSDLSRAHYILLLGSDHQEGSWGTLQPTMRYEADIAHSRKTKGTKLIVVGSQKSTYADLRINSFKSSRNRSFLLLQNLQSLKSEWFDRHLLSNTQSVFQSYKIT